MKDLLKAVGILLVGAVLVFLPVLIWGSVGYVLWHFIKKFW